MQQETALSASQIIPAPPPAFDPFSQPHLFQAVTAKRVVAYAIDVIVLAALGGASWVAMSLLGLMTLGILLPLVPVVVAIVPLAYHILLVASPQAATVGMRVMKIKVASIDGRPPTMVQAAVQIVCFYGSVTLTGGFILIVALFNAKRRTLHDFLAGTLVINHENGL